MSSTSRLTAYRGGVRSRHPLPKSRHFGRRSRDPSSLPLLPGDRIMGHDHEVTGQSTEHRSTRRSKAAKQRSAPEGSRTSDKQVKLWNLFKIRRDRRFDTRRLGSRQPVPHPLPARVLQPIHLADRHRRVGRLAGRLPRHRRAGRPSDDPRVTPNQGDAPLAARLPWGCPPR